MKLVRHDIRALRRFVVAIDDALDDVATLVVLDPYDLAVSKLLRGNDHDREQLALLHAGHTLDPALLIARFRDLLDDYVGNPRECEWSLYHFVAEVWGETVAEDVRPR